MAASLFCTSGCCAAVSVVSGELHTCALLANGAVKCWGGNNSGQLGDGTLVDRLTPTHVAGVSAAREISAGAGHTCALLAGGGIKCWGLNLSGQLGNGTLDSGFVASDVVGFSSNAVNVEAGGMHSCARDAVGALSCWGDNSVGQVGDMSSENRPVPSSVVGLGFQVARVSAGWRHSCAIKSSQLFCWGSYPGAAQSSSVPVLLSSFGSFIDISGGLAHACGILPSGALKCWGYNGDGALGDGTTTDSTVPVQVLGLTSDVQSVHSFYGHGCALRADRLYCWGANQYGQVGDGTLVNRSAPFEVPLDRVYAVGPGHFHTCAAADGGVWCWGHNDFGQLGDGTFRSRATPDLIIDR